MQEQMHTLVQGIVGAYEARVSSLAFLQKQVVAQLEGLRRTRQAMARQQRTHLSRGRADLASEVEGWLREVAGSRQAMARQQRAHLSRGRADLASEVEGWLRGVAGSHQAMARQQRAELARGRAGLRASVSNQLQELDRDHNAMAQRQREDLARGRAGLIRAERLRKSEVKTWIEDVAAIHAGARAVWQELAATMGAKRAGGVAVAEAAPAAPVAVAHEEEAVAEAVVGEVTEEFSTLRDRVFEYLANHPDGARLTEIERDFGLGRFEAARVARSLTNDGKAEKRDLLYFAI